MMRKNEFLVLVQDMNSFTSVSRVAMKSPEARLPLELNLVSAKACDIN